MSTNNRTTDLIPIHAAMPPARTETRIEVSAQMARVWQLLRSSQDWLTNEEIAQEAQVSRSAARTYTRYWLGVGLVERHETFPRHIYRLAPDAERQYARLWQHLETCTAILLQRAKNGK